MKKKPVKKKSSSFAKAIKAWEEQSKARYRVAKASFDAQDAETQEAINRIRDRIVSYSTGMIQIRVPGQNLVPVQVDFKYIDFNSLYLACEIMKDLAILDIRVANYEFPEMFCSECGEIIKTKKKKKKKKGKK